MACSMFGLYSAETARLASARMHCAASSGSAAELARATSGLMPLHSISSRWLWAETQRFATAQAVSRCTATLTLRSSRARSSETRDDIVTWLG